MDDVDWPDRVIGVKGGARHGAGRNRTGRSTAEATRSAKSRGSTRIAAAVLWRERRGTATAWCRIIASHIPSARRRRTDWGCTTCSATCGSCVRTGTEPTCPVPSPIRQVPPRASSASAAVAAGAGAPDDLVRADDGACPVRHGYGPHLSTRSSVYSGRGGSFPPASAMRTFQRFSRPGRWGYELK